MNDSMRKREAVSDVMDGRLHGQAFSDAVRVLDADESARLAWHAYHVVGDVLRSSELATCQGDAAFLERLRGRLQREQHRNPMAVVDPAAGASGVTMGAAPPAANDPLFPWKWAAGFFSVLAAVAIGWNMRGLAAPGMDESVSVAADAVRQAEPALTQGEQVMIRDARLDQLLQAHRQSGGASALQVPSGFLRNATFEVSAR